VTIQAKRTCMLLLPCALINCSSGASVRAIRLWRGDRGCSACANAALDVIADPSSTVDLVPDETYTVEIQLRHPDDSRCLFFPVHGTWLLPDRNFVCDLEQDVSTYMFSTQRDWPPPAGPSLEINLNEYSSEDRKWQATLFTKRYAVRWVSR
jgi:hypothetical protein